MIGFFLESEQSFGVCVFFCICAHDFEYVYLFVLLLHKHLVFIVDEILYAFCNLSSDDEILKLIFNPLKISPDSVVDGDG